MMNLHIQLDSFELINNFIQPDDNIRITLTTFPGEQNQSINIDSKKIRKDHPIFTVEINKLTKKIIMVFRKKSIFASTIIRSDQFPNKINEKYNIEMRSIPLFEPYPKNSKNNQSSLENRKVIGKLEAQFVLSDRIPQNKNNNIIKQMK